MALTAACSTQVVRNDLESGRIEAASKSRLACAYQLPLVFDARPEEDAGRISRQLFRLREPDRVVLSQLAASGWSEDADATPVEMKIKRLYLTQNRSTKIPVAVYEVTVGSDAPVLLRAQPASMNWNGTENEAYSAYSKAMAEANEKLVVHLNARCTNRSTHDSAHRPG